MIFYLKYKSAIGILLELKLLLDHKFYDTIILFQLKGARIFNSKLNTQWLNITYGRDFSFAHTKLNNIKYIKQ